MPVDHKRINGPENTEPYHLYSKQHQNKLEETFKKLYVEGKRLDNRKPEELRKICMKQLIRIPTTALIYYPHSRYENRHRDSSKRFRIS